jgi:hypothetical protein
MTGWNDIKGSKWTSVGGNGKWTDDLKQSKWLDVEKKEKKKTGKVIKRSGPKNK